MPERSSVAAVTAGSKASETGSEPRDEAGRVLLEAIKNSTTHMDQIVLRRIGLNENRPRNLK